MKTILTITIILINSFYVKCQVIRGLAYNHAVVNAIAEGDKSYLKSLDKSIDFEDEFFDDFSDYGNSVFPRNNHWADNYAYINSTYADSMISLGVATLDAYDKKGYPYYSPTLSIAPSDTLTSLPFRFLNPLSGIYYFSFFYQAGGKGDMPEGIISDEIGVEGKDSLLLDFYSPAQEEWINVFYTLDNTDTFHFKQVILEVDDAFLHDGFRFRFRNYTSLPKYPQGQDLGMFGNADQWHIDYIQIKQAESLQDMQNLNDIIVVEPLLSSFTEYIAVPWRHYTLAQSAENNERGTIPFAFRTYYPGESEPIARIDRLYKTTNLRTEEELNFRNYHNDDESPYSYLRYQDNFKTNLFYDASDSMGKLEIMAYLETTEGETQRRINDTVRRIETYYDHYAYDDGSAEFGFGIGGEPQEKSRIALRFRTFRSAENPDSLKAVSIYFCKSIDSATINAEYRISIRKNDGEKPADDTLFTSDVFTPDYNARLNEFTRIEINPPLLIADTFFVVIEQLSGYLNIGYDINNNNLKNLYVYNNQVWENPYSITKGTLMVRPSFGNYSLPAEISKNDGKETFLLFPNPATDHLNFYFTPDYHGPVTVQIFNTLGIIQYHSITDESTISINNLSKGIYFVVITTTDYKKQFTAKFIKQ